MTDDIDDGSKHPLGHQTDDGELEVRQEADGSKVFTETPLGQHQRWMRQAPDLFEAHMEGRKHHGALLQLKPSIDWYAADGHHTGMPVALVKSLKILALILSNMDAPATPAKEQA